MKRKIPSDINKDAEMFGIPIMKFFLILILTIILLVRTIINISISKIISGVILWIIMSLFIIFNLREEIEKRIKYKKSNKNINLESVAMFPEIDDVCQTKKIKSVFLEVNQAINFSSFDEEYQDRIASDFAATIYEVTANGGTVKMTSYSSPEDTTGLYKKLEGIESLEISDTAKKILESRLSLHGKIAEKAVKNNYILRIDMPLKEEFDWDDIIPNFGEVIGKNLIKHHAIKQFVPLYNEVRGKE